MKDKDNDRFLTKCKTVSRDWLQNKHIIDVECISNDNFVDVLQADTLLTNMSKSIITEIGEITVDP